MKKFEHKPGTGSLFKNNYKKTPRQPDINGQLKVSRDYKSGEVINFAGWVHEGPKAKYYSLSESNNNLKSDDLNVINIDVWDASHD
jgi:hypothetical protein